MDGGVMGWARLDDGWHDHRKVVAAGIEAAGLWAMCLTWAHRERRTSKTPGVVPDAVITRFVGNAARARKLTARLHEVGMLDAHTDGGWPIHDFADYLPRTVDPEVAAEHGRKGGRPRKPRPDEEKGSTLFAETLEPFDWEGATLPDEKGPSRVRASAPASPNPNPYPEDQNPSATTSPRAEVEPATKPITAQTLVGEWIDHCDGEVPKRMRGQVAKRLGEILAEGIDPNQVRAGLALWHQRGLTSPSAIDSCVFEAGRTSPIAPRRTAPTNGHAPKPSTTDERVGAGLALAAKYAAAEGQPLPRLAIGGAP